MSNLRNRYKYYPIVDMGNYEEKQINIAISEPVSQPKPFQTLFIPCVHGDNGIVIKYYCSEYGFLTTIRDTICKDCLKD